MRRVWVVLAAVLLTSSTAAVAAPERGSASGRLAGTTVIKFAGNTAIRLVTLRTQLRGEDVEIRMTRGSYAFVRLIQPGESDCDPSVGPRCNAFWFDWVKGYTTDWTERAPEYRHMAVVTDPPTLVGPTLDAYFLTDGAGELTIRTRLPGRTAYRAGGRFTGTGAPLALHCVSGCGSSDTSTFKYAGVEYDLGAEGWAGVLVLSRNARGTNDTNNGFSGSEACLSPNPASPAASSRPNDHPYGCGLPPYPTQREYVDAGYGAVNLVAGLTPTSANGSLVWWTAAKGKQYFGGRVAVAGVEVRSIQVFAIAFRYGIR